MKPRAIYVTSSPNQGIFPVCILGQFGSNGPHPVDHPGAGGCQGEQHTEEDLWTPVTHALDCWLGTGIFVSGLSLLICTKGQKDLSQALLGILVCDSSGGCWYVPGPAGPRSDCRGLQRTGPAAGASPWLGPEEATAVPHQALQGEPQLLLPGEPQRGFSQASRKCSCTSRTV